VALKDSNGGIMELIMFLQKLSQAMTGYQEE